MAQRKTKSPSSSAKKKRWQFELGLFGLLGLGLVGILIMAWAFILGILVGRGYNPESVIPEIGRIVTPTTPPLSTPPRTVLQPEELRFHETLQERGSQPVPTVPRRTEPTRPTGQQGQQVAPQARQPLEDRLSGAPQSTARTQPSIPSETPVPSFVAPPETSGPRFEFVYQVASFQNDAQARSLQQSITSGGLLASVEAGVVNGRQWYRVLVTIRGSQADADQAKLRLQDLGISGPFLRAKKSL